MISEKLWRRTQGVKGNVSAERITLSSLTVSNFGRIILHQSNHAKLAEEILHSKLPDTIPSLKWDRTHENEVS